MKLYMDQINIISYFDEPSMRMKSWILRNSKNPQIQEFEDSVEEFKTYLKEKILTELSHVVRQFQERNVKEYMVKKIEEQMEDFINSLPSEKEMAKELHAEWLELPMDKLISFPDWLDRRQND